jgi:protein-S-isoprenylcysteine O-methyltransferase Ste14
MLNTKGKSARMAVWFAYFIIVFEIIYMITPFAFYFYSFYGVPLEALSSNRVTHWLTTFMLPHFSQSSSIIAAVAEISGWPLIAIGIMFFMIAFTQIYYSKFAKKGAVKGGLYNYILHPQYTALALLGLGALFVWPRFIVLLMFATMIFIYYYLAKVEENECIEKFGESYIQYHSNTGMFMPKVIEQKLPVLPAIFPAKGAARVLSIIAMYILVIGSVTALGLLVRENSLNSVSGIFYDRTVVISLPLMEKNKLESLYSLVSEEKEFVSEMSSGTHICFVIPLNWTIPELPGINGAVSREHSMPENYGDDFRIIVNRVKTHGDETRGKDIIFSAYDLEPVSAYQIVKGKVARENVVSKGKWSMLPIPLL